MPSAHPREAIDAEPESTVEEADVASAASSDDGSEACRSVEDGADGALRAASETTSEDAVSDDVLVADAKRFLELAQRTQADFENYRKRALRESKLAEGRGVTRLAKELLPALDNLERALQSAAADDPLLAGIRLVQADLVGALERVGIASYSPQGERFDPAEHEAVAQQPVDGAEPGTVVEVYQAGYKQGENVLRPARVVVAA